MPNPEQLEEEAGRAGVLRRLHAEIDAELEASRLALAGEPDPLTYEDRVEEAYRRRSGASLGPPSSPTVDADLERIVDELERGWREAAKPGGVLERADARLAARPREPEGGRDR